MKTITIKKIETIILFGFDKYIYNGVKYNILAIEIKNNIQCILNCCCGVIFDHDIYHVMYNVYDHLDLF